MTSTEKTAGRGYVTDITARVGSASTGDELSTPDGRVSLSLLWSGGPTALATVTAVRMFRGSVVANDNSVLPVVEEPGYQDEWVVSEPTPRDGEFKNGNRGSGEFVVPAEGPIVAPLYQAATFAPSQLIGGPREALVLDWELPHRCLCRMTIRYAESGSREWIVYSVGPFGLRDVKGLYQGRFRYWLDCFPEIASVDDVLDPVRAPRFAAGTGRLARVQTIGTFEVR